MGALPEAALPVGALRVGGTDWGLAKVRPDPDLCTFLALALALAF